MLCPKCGKDLNDGAMFCPDCGTNLSQEQTVSAPMQQEVQPQPIYVPPVYDKPKKKRHVGRWIALIIFLLIVGGGLYVYGTISWFPPKDLGVKYTQADYISFESKIGIVKNMNGTLSSNYIIKKVSTADSQSANGKISDYSYSFSGSKEINVVLTQEELTAWLNENRPSYFAIKNSQIKINDDGSVEASGEIDFDAVQYLVVRSYPNFKSSMVPIPLPQKANVYISGKGTMTNNTPEFESLDGSIGAISVKPFLTEKNIEILEKAIITVLAKEVPQFNISSMTFDDGKVTIVGEIPEKFERIKITEQ